MTRQFIYGIVFGLILSMIFTRFILHITLEPTLVVSELQVDL